MVRRYRVTSPRTGKTVTLLDPAGKGAKYAHELKTKRRYTNEGRVKVNPNTGEVQKLTKAQRSYRAGYLDARKDNAKAWCKKNGVPSKAKRRGNQRRGSSRNLPVIFDSRGY